MILWIEKRLNKKWGHVFFFQKPLGPQASLLVMANKF